MKYLVSILIFVLHIQVSFSQGLNAELSFNSTIAQYAHTMVNVGEFSYFTMSQSQIMGSQYLLVKTDTSGNTIWSTPLDFPLNNLNDPVTLIPTADSGILVYGDAYFCDVAINCIDYIQKFDGNGNLEWSKEWLDAWCNRISITGVSSDSSFIYANYFQSDTSAVLQYNLAGNLLDSLPIDQNNLIQVQNFGIYEKTGISSHWLFGFDSLGNSIFSRYFSGNIQSFETLNDTLYLLTSDSIFSFDTSFQLLDANHNIFFPEFTNLKVYPYEIRFLCTAGGQENIFVLDHDLQFGNIIVIPEIIPAGTPKDINQSHFTAAINFELYEFNAIRHLDYSLQSNQNTIVNRTDIGIIDIQATQVSCTPHWQTNVYYFDIAADVLIKNYGNQTLNECNINHFVTYGICEIVDYFEHFTNLNLAPGDSMWLSCGEIHNNLDFLAGPDTLRKTICVYTSQPNLITDLNVANDHYCESVVVGYVGIQENEKIEFDIYPNPTTNFLNIKTELTEEMEFEIYDLQGKIVLKNQQLSDLIDVSCLTDGPYFIRIISKNNPYSTFQSFIKD